MTSLELCMVFEDCRYSTCMLEASICKPISQLYTEGFGDSIDRAVDKIKVFFAKLVNNIRTLFKKISIRLDYFFRKMELNKQLNTNIKNWENLPNDTIYAPNLNAISNALSMSISDLKLCLGRFKRAASTNDFDDLSEYFIEFRELCSKSQATMVSVVNNNYIMIPRNEYIAQMKKAQRSGYGFEKLSSDFDMLMEILEAESVRIYQNKTLDIAVREKYSSEYQKMGIDTMKVFTELSSLIVKSYESPKFK